MITRRQGLKLAAVLTLAGAVPFGRPAFAETKSIRIGWQKFGVLGLAKQQGALEKRFADRGINIEWSEFTSGPPLLEALGAGSLDFGPTGDVPPLFAQAARGDLLYVGTYKPPAAFHGILVHKDSPIRTLADLKGVKLAYKRGSSAHNFAFKALAKARLTPSDVQEVDLPPPDAAAAQANIDGTTEALSKITGVPADVTRVTLTRSGSDLGKVATVSDEAVAYQQALADDFHALGSSPSRTSSGGRKPVDAHS